MKKFVNVDTVAMLKFRHQDIEIHLKNTNGLFNPLNWFQVLLYKILGFDYINGIEYIDMMVNRFKDSNNNFKEQYNKYIFIK
jgi:hypothetical protein